jgi:uncharacterized protein (DUF1501 family)
MNTPNIITRRSFLRRSALLAGAVGGASTIRDMRLMNTLMAADPPTDYKALVCVFLAGGNDANNWIVPTDATTYGEYATARGNLVIAQNSLLPLRTGPLVTDPAYSYQGRTYGIHPGCTRLQTLFGEKKLAVVLNVGTLVRPTTKAQYNSGLAAYRPPQLFSHSDQVTQWQTSIPDQPPTTGWGGRVADLFDSIANPSGQISMSVSLNGANTFQVGNLVAQYHVSTSGAVIFNSAGNGGGFMGANGVRQKALQGIIDLAHSNLQRQAYASVLDNAIFTGDLLNTNIQATATSTDTPPGTWVWNTPFPNTTLGNQLKMVARLIQASGPSGFNMKRQIFYTTLGGFDTHTSQVTFNANGTVNTTTGTHADLLTQVSEAMYAFQRAMVQLGLDDKVTQFTASDFSRTLPSNSQGSDHGWGSHHIIVGGGVDGGKFFGKLQNFAISGPDDTGIGRWIPTTAVDEHTATLAKWYGLNQNDINAVLPNVTRFPSTYGSNYIGFMKPA